ncbi:hypothetical protein ACHQM5_002710 [Ranunculus cassubicifolius]
MNSLENRRRKKSLKERLGFAGMGCCGGASWTVRNSSADMIIREEQVEEDSTNTGQNQPEECISDQDCIEESSAAAGMNLATALAAERQLRAQNEGDNDSVDPAVVNADVVPISTPLRVSLMRLLEEADGVDEKKRGLGGSDGMCCVCMGRRKGAAFIPCGHTFCRMCSRELWLNRGSCPICNRSILEILDIY